MAQTILIVDDDSALRSGLSLLAKTAGQQPLLAATVAEALEHLSSEPAVALLDLNLPDGLGTDILRHIRSAKLPIRVAVLTGSLNEDLLAEVTALQPDAVFRKPPDWDQLLQWFAHAA